MEAALEPGEKRHEHFFSSCQNGVTSGPIHLGIDPEGDGVYAGHPQEGGSHAPVQSAHSILPVNEPLKKFMHGLSLFYLTQSSKQSKVPL